MQKKILKIMRQLSKGDINYTSASKHVVYLLGVSDIFSTEKLEKAYKDGVRDALAKGYGTFDVEKYH